MCAIPSRDICSTDIWMPAKCRAQLCYAVLNNAKLLHKVLVEAENGLVNTWGK